MPEVGAYGFTDWHRGDRLSRIDRLQTTATGWAHAVALQAGLLTLEASDVSGLAILAPDRPRHQRMVTFDPSCGLFLVCLHMSLQHWSSHSYPPAAIVPFLGSTALPRASSIYLKVTTS